MKSLIPTSKLKFIETKKKQRHKAFDVQINLKNSLEYFQLLNNSEDFQTEEQKIIFLQNQKFPNQSDLLNIFLDLEIETRTTATKLENFKGQLELDRRQEKLFWRFCLMTTFETQVNKVVKALSQAIYGSDRRDPSIQVQIAYRPEDSFRNAVDATYRYPLLAYGIVTKQLAEFQRSPDEGIEFFLSAWTQWVIALTLFGKTKQNQLPSETEIKSNLLDLKNILSQISEDKIPIPLQGSQFFDHLTLVEKIVLENE